MPIPTLSIIASPDDATAELVVHGVLAGDTPEAPGFDPELLAALGVTGKREQIVRAVVDGRRVAFAGLGDDVTPTRLREVAGDFACCDARREPALVAEFRRKGYEINDGLIVSVNDRLLYGPDATRFLVDIAQPRSFYARALVWSVGAAPWARALYPVLVVARKALLRIAGRRLIG